MRLLYRRKSTPIDDRRTERLFPGRNVQYVRDISGNFFYIELPEDCPKGDVYETENGVISISGRTLTPRFLTLSDITITTNSTHPLYGTWTALRQRCRKGTAGLCEAWYHSFETFARDVGPKIPGATLRRTDTAAPYGPGNFQWSRGSRN